jgi:hypothetical protein
MPGRSAGIQALDLDGVAVLQPGLAMDQLGAGVLEVADVDAGEPGDLLVLFHQEPRPVEAGVGDIPAVAPGGLEMLRIFRGVDHELLGHAAADHAGAADAMFLSDRHLGAGHGRDPGRAHAAGARPDDEEVVVVAGQAGLLECFRAPAS